MKTTSKNNNIKVKSLSAAELFSDWPLNLPEYQRPYSWSIDDVKLLLQDLTEYTDTLSHNKSIPMLYMGSIILHEEIKPRSKTPIFNIIDGQQRITTLQLICMVIKAKRETRRFKLPQMTYSSPLSHQLIIKNFEWLNKQEFSDNLLKLDLNKINFTLVVTYSEDKAYRFFETQNTGGIRLTGPEVIKAHHLRAIEKNKQDSFARKWERFLYLNDVVNNLLKIRSWQKLAWKNVSSHRNPPEVKKEIITEFATKTANNQEDIAYFRGQKVKAGLGMGNWITCESYLTRQPLNSGINTVNYFDYFCELYLSLFFDKEDPNLNEFYTFNNKVINKANESVYLTDLYNSCILLYVSEFGTQHLIEASYWIARCVFSIRLANKKAVKEDSIVSFVKQYPIFDWISTSYTHTQLMHYLTRFEYKISPENIGADTKSNTIKKRFLEGYAKYFAIRIAKQNGSTISNRFDQDLKGKIKEKTHSIDKNYLEKY